MTEINTKAVMALHADEDAYGLYHQVPDLCAEIDHLRAALGAALEDVRARTWERDHANASYHRLHVEHTALRMAQYKPKAPADD